MRRRRAFQRRPFLTLVRATGLAARLLTGTGARLRAPFGSVHFTFEYAHNEAGRVGRNFYMSRNLIEDLMEYGDRLLRIGDVVIDAGANEGFFTAAFGKYIGGAGRVIAIEPVPHCVGRIERNARLNKIDDRVKAIAAAVSDKAGKTTLDISQGIGRASIARDMGGSNLIEVEAVTIDGVVEAEGLNRLDFIKIDIEGAEFMALKGAARSIARFKPIICLEMLELDDMDVFEAHEYMIELDYVPFHFVRGALQPVDGPPAPPYPNLFYLPRERYDL